MALVFILEVMHSLCGCPDPCASFCHFWLCSGRCRCSPSCKHGILPQISSCGAPPVLRHGPPPPQLCFSYLMKERSLSDAASLLCYCWKVSESEGSCWKTDSVDTSVALILFIRGSGNYLLRRRLNKSAAIINYKQVARRNLHLFAVYFLSQSESELDLKLPFSYRKSRSSLSETHFKFLLFLLH